MQDFESALILLDRAKAIDPYNGEIYSHRGNVYFSMKDYSSAVEEYSLAIEYKGNLENTYYNRGLTYLKLGEKELARSDFLNLLEITSDKTIIETIDQILSEIS